MDVSSVYNNQLDIQSLLLANTTNKTTGGNSNDTTNNTGYYAKKGEPMYMADMDSDEDGIVTLDEFRDYCKSKGINTREMIKMSQTASSYRVMMAEEDTINYISKLIPNISPKLKQSEYLKPNENQYNISPNSDKKVSYQEYMEYCQQNSVQNEYKSNSKVENSDDGTLKISNKGYAVKSYKDSEDESVKSTFEKAV